MTDRQIGGSGLNVDIVPTADRWAGAVGINVDYKVPLGVSIGSANLNVDIVPTPARLLGAVGLMVDYVAGLITAGIGWSGTQFVASGGTPVLWGAATFQTSGGYPPVQWEDGVFST